MSDETWSACENSLRIVLAHDPAALETQIRWLRYVRSLNPPVAAKAPSLFRRLFCRKLP